MNIENIEAEYADLLVSFATEYASDYVDVEDLDAATVALLARAIEQASGRKVNFLEMFL